MRVKEYQLDELARARALQDEAAKLHIPVPVLSYQYEIADADGNIEEKGIGKSNSYTRNALNSIAYFAGMSDTAIDTGAFADGTTMCRYVDMYYSSDSIIPAFSAVKRSGNSVNFGVVLGVSDAPESLDSYLIPTSGLSTTTSTRSSVFNPTTRKLITLHTTLFKNNTEETISITESGMAVHVLATTTPFNRSYFMLYVRDVFAPIPVEPGKSITWTYVTEVAYPEP